MPIVECGFPSTPNPADTLVLTGPTIRVDIGFDLNIITAGAAAAGVPPPAAAGPVSLMQNVPALIDTGAYQSCIDEDLAQQLQRPLINQAQSSGVHGPGMLNVYLAYISIPLLGTTQAGQFIGAKLNAGGQPHKALIGRMLLRDTLLVYDGRHGTVRIAR